MLPFSEATQHFIDFSKTHVTFFSCVLCVFALWNPVLDPEFPQSLCIFLISVPPEALSLAQENTHLLTIIEVPLQSDGC